MPVRRASLALGWTWWLLTQMGCSHLAQPPDDASQCTGLTALVPGVPGSPGHLLPSRSNPAGDSELAALMRRFVDELAHVRRAVVAHGPRPVLLPAHRRLRCAWPTDPGDRTPTFDALAIAYLAQVQALDAAGADATAEYGRVIEACRACHQASCPGPLDLIDGLR